MSFRPRWFRLTYRSLARSRISQVFLVVALVSATASCIVALTLSATAKSVLEPVPSNLVVAAPNPYMTAFDGVHGKVVPEFHPEQYPMVQDKAALYVTTVRLLPPPDASNPTSLLQYPSFDTFSWPRPAWLQPKIVEGTAPNEGELAVSATSGFHVNDVVYANGLTPLRVSAVVETPSSLSLPYVPLVFLPESQVKEISPSALYILVLQPTSGETAESLATVLRADPAAITWDISTASARLAKDSAAMQTTVDQLQAWVAAFALTSVVVSLFVVSMAVQVDLAAKRQSLERLSILGATFWQQKLTLLCSSALFALATCVFGVFAGLVVASRFLTSVSEYSTQVSLVVPWYVLLVPLVLTSLVLPLVLRSDSHRLRIPSWLWVTAFGGFAFGFWRLALYSPFFWTASLACALCLVLASCRFWPFLSKLVAFRSLRSPSFHASSWLLSNRRRLVSCATALSGAFMLAGFCAGLSPSAAETALRVTQVGLTPPGSAATATSLLRWLPVLPVTLASLSAALVLVLSFRDHRRDRQLLQALGATTWFSFRQLAFQTLCLVGFAQMGSLIGLFASSTALARASQLGLTPVSPDYLLLVELALVTAVVLLGTSAVLAFSTTKTSSSLD